MKVELVLDDIKEARIIKGFFEENQVDVKIYNDIRDLYTSSEKSDIVLLDMKHIDVGELRPLKTKSDAVVVFIVPFWMKFSSDDARKIGRKLGFRSGKYIKRPFTPQDLLEYCKMTLEKKQND